MPYLLVATNPAQKITEFDSKCPVPKDSIEWKDCAPAFPDGTPEKNWPIAAMRNTKLTVSSATFKVRAGVTLKNVTVTGKADLGAGLVLTFTKAGLSQAGTQITTGPMAADNPLPNVVTQFTNAAMMRIQWTITAPGMISAGSSSHSVYAIQVRVASVSPAEALFSATARWGEALRLLGLEACPLQRSEVLTPEEFERDRASGPSAAVLVPQAAPVGEGDELLRSAFYDSLTGFPTLALFRDRAEGLASSLAQSGRRLALLVVDIDGFGAVNRDLGYIYGDRVLVEMAGRLAQLTESTWPVARLVGDESSYWSTTSWGGPRR